MTPLCPCGADKNLSQCCGVYIEGQATAPTPEALMRSRYTAFAIKAMDYLVETTDPQTRMEYDFAANQEWAEKSQFIKLEILNHSMNGNKGTVEFKAHFQNADSSPQIHHELSKFRKQAGVWYFREGKVF